jgi:HNH endonuclease
LDLSGIVDVTDLKLAAPWLSRMKRQKRYPPVGRCIYCGGDGSPGRLSDEHIIPESLGGTLILPTATCKACSDLTSAFEGQNAGRLFRPIRRQLNFPSKGRGRARRDARAHEQFVVKVNGKKRYISTADYPGLLISFVFPLPTILLGLKPEFRSFTGGISLATLPKFGERLDSLRAKYGEHLEFPVFGSAETVGRLLAKIGHCYAVAQIGIDTFKPYLLGVIRDQDPTFLHHVVGSAGGNALARDDLHEISILPPEQFGSSRLIIVRVHLFANVDGMAVHYVVAGERL